jgi:mono/diheme cytochrome c family protein
LLNSAVVKGNPETVIRTVLEGPAAVLPAEREKYQVVMPPMGPVLDDETVAGVVTYIRTKFGDGASAVTPQQVKALRK